MSATESNIREIMQTLYTDHHGWLFGWLCKKLGCSHRAADLAQDTFVSALTSPHATRIKEPRAFLVTLARRAVFDFWRRRDIEQAYLDALAAMPLSFVPSAEDLSIIYEAVETIDRLLNGLPERVKQAFLLSRLEGRTHVEIAELLGVSVASVERYMKRAFVHCCLLQQSLSMNN